MVEPSGVGTEHAWLRLLPLGLTGRGIEGAALNLGLLFCGLGIITPSNLAFEDCGG